MRFGCIVSNTSIARRLESTAGSVDAPGSNPSKYMFSISKLNNIITSIFQITLNRLSFEIVYHDWETGTRSDFLEDYVQIIVKKKDFKLK